MMLGTPELLAEWAGRRVSGVSGTVVFAAVPLVTVLMVARDEHGVRRFLGPGLLALAGMMLLLPFKVPESEMEWLSLGVLVLAAALAAVSSVGMYRLLRLRWSGLSLQIGLGSALAVVQVVFLVWLLGKMPTLRLAGRYLLIPLLTVAEGYVRMRPGLTFRMGTEIVLLAVGVGWILFSG